MKALVDKLKTKLTSSALLCVILHKKYWVWSGKNGFKIQHCPKCDKSWVTHIENAVGKKVSK